MEQDLKHWMTLIMDMEQEFEIYDREKHQQTNKVGKWMPFELLDSMYTLKIKITGTMDISRFNIC